MTQTIIRVIEISLNMLGSKCTRKQVSISRREDASVIICSQVKLWDAYKYSLIGVSMNSPPIESSNGVLFVIFSMNSPRTIRIYLHINIRGAVSCKRIRDNFKIGRIGTRNTFFFIRVIHLWEIPGFVWLKG